MVRLDNLIYLFNSVFDAARWPASVFRGVWRIVFTFVVPLALMTTYPALALLGRLDGDDRAARAGGGALLFVLAGARWCGAARSDTIARRRREATIVAWTATDD